MRSHFLLVAALAAASASQPASAGEAGAVLTNQELQRLIPGNESTAASKLGGTHRRFSARRNFVPQPPMDRETSHRKQPEGSNASDIHEDRWDIVD
jgi:hypothetical protein